MRRYAPSLLILAVLAIGLTARADSEFQPLSMSIWQPGGISQQAADVVAATAQSHRGDWAFVRSGTIQLLSVTRGEETVQDARPGYRYPMSSIAVEPEAVRSRIGDEAANALAAGLLVMGQSSADLRGAQVGDVARFYGWDLRIHEMEIGAVVADEPVRNAEFVFSYESADAIEFDRLASVWVWSIEYHDAFLIDLWQRLPDETTRVRSSSDPNDPDSVLSVIRVKEEFGEFAYRPLPGDNIVIDPDWVSANIETRTLPLLGSFRCHKNVWPLLEEALDRIVEAGLDSRINRSDFRRAGGCYVPREIRGGDKGGSISRHSWGIAIDINPGTNPYGGRITMDQDIVEIFRDLGFAWGGGWTFSDGGHFEWKQHTEG